ncbi:MAG TPA: AI-2E family transporter [Terriglobales bacterium]
MYEQPHKSLRNDIVFAIALLAVLAAAWTIRNILLLVYVSALFAVVLSPAIELIRRMHIGKWRPGRGGAILVLILAGIGLVAGIGLLILPPIYRDLHAFAVDLPHRTAGVLARMRSLPFGMNFDPALLEQHAAEAVGGAFGVFRTITGGLMGAFTCVILTAYFIVDGERTFHWALSLLPAEHRPRISATMIRAEARVRHWLIGQAALMAILGISVAIVFGLLQIKYFYALAVIAGILNIVPIIGPLIALVLAAIIAAFDSWTKLAGVLLFFAVYQQVENAILTPRIMKLSVDLPPLAVIIALLIGGALAGVLGALIAVPTAALLAVLADEYLVRKDDAEVTAAK